jgi:hypothetical protein
MNDGRSRLTQIFHEARFARREIWSKTGSLDRSSPFIRFVWGPNAPLQNV